MNAIPTDFDRLAHAIAFATVKSDIEVYAARVTVDGHEYWDTTRPRHDSEPPDEDLAYLQRAVAYIDKAGDVFPWRMLRHIASPGLVRFVEHDSKTDDDGMCYCQEGVVCPACEQPGPAAIATAAPAASIQILIEWLSRRFGAVIDAGELPNPVVTAVREIERWLNPALFMPEAPR